MGLTFIALILIGFVILAIVVGIVVAIVASSSRRRDE